MWYASAVYFFQKMSTPTKAYAPTPPVSVTVVPLPSAFAMQFDASLSVLPKTSETPQYIGAFSAEQERAILDILNLKKQYPPSSV